jgi:hypothetical protein
VRLDITDRLLRFDGRPSGATVLAISACVAIAFTAAFVTRVSRGTDSPRSQAVPESRLTGEVVSAEDRAAAPRLRHAAALPALARPAPKRKRARTRHVPSVTKVETQVAAPTATPQATAAPTSTPAPPAFSVPPPAPTATNPTPSQPAPTPGQTFDSSG